jgi:hypothetical protein
MAVTQVKDEFNNEDIQSVVDDAFALSGASTDGSVTLTGADTWVPVPSTAPTSSYVLVVTKESETGTIRWSFDNGGVPSATNGNKLVEDGREFVLAGSQVVYFGSTDATDVVNWSAKVI